MTRKFIYYSLKKRIRYAAIPKNASVSVRTYIDGMDINGPFYEDGIEPIHPECLKFPIFALLRNPIDRWFSTYKYLSQKYLNNIGYDSYLFSCRNTIANDNRLEAFNPHLVRQSDYLKGLKDLTYVITMRDLEKVFPDIGIHNASRKRMGVLVMPDDIKKYYEEDFALFNYYKHKSDWRELRTWLKI
jgi:hypothetical protein